jgi:sugar (pentulose or hexulose) kinase
MGAELMSDFLLIDFGTTSTKSIRVDINTGIFSNPHSTNALRNVAKYSSYHEFDMYEVKKRFEDICIDNYNLSPFTGIIICSEMHGFSILDLNNRPITNYISWKDERSIEKIENKNSAFRDICNYWKDDFKKITGMTPRPGFMPMSLLHISRTNILPSDIRIVDLPGWLSRSTGFATGHLHTSMLAGLGIYDINKNMIAENLISWLSDKIGSRIHLDKPEEIPAVSGYWQKIPIYVGVGDHQCSLLGAGLVDDGALSINIGTGAQISTLNSNKFPEESELRPFLFDQYLKTITHVPGGRALATYVNFIQQLTGPHFNIWEDLSNLDVKSIEEGSLFFQFSTFSSARGYKDGGAISHITEETLNIENYLNSLLRSFAEQYIEMTKFFDPNMTHHSLIISGGISRRLPALVEFIQRNTDYNVIGATDVDESLLGLRTIALLISGCAKDIQSAKEYFGADITIKDA